MSDLFEKRVICGREIINPFRSKNSMDHLANNAEHSLKTIIDRLYWVEKERDELKDCLVDVLMGIQGGAWSKKMLEDRINEVMPLIQDKYSEELDEMSRIIREGD